MLEPLGVGAALGVLIGYASAFVLAVVLTRSVAPGALARSWPVAQRFALLAAYATGFAVSRAIDETFESIPGLVVALLAGTAAYAGTLILARGITPSDRQRLAYLRARARSSPGTVPGTG